MRTIRPLATFIPLFNAAYFPCIFSLNNLRFLIFNLLLIFNIILPVASFELLSITIASNLGYFELITELTVLAILYSSLYAGIITETNGLSLDNLFLLNVLLNIKLRYITPLTANIPIPNIKNILKNLFIYAKISKLTLAAFEIIFSFKLIGLSNSCKFPASSPSISLKL